MADLMESYDTLIEINLYFDYYEIFFINKEIWTNVRAMSLTWNWQT